MANSACSISPHVISGAFISKEGNELLDNIKAARYVDFINTLFGEIFAKEYLDNDSYVTLSDFTDDNNKLTVNGNLNRLYTKVQNKLEELIDSGFIDTLPEATTTNLKVILENWKLFVDFHSKYNAYIAIRPEDLMTEEEKETNNYDKKGNEHSVFNLLTNEVRTLFKFLPKAELVKTDGKLVASAVINPVDGLPVRGDFENIFKLTLDALKGIKDPDEFTEKLISIELLHRVPEIGFLLEILPVQNGIQNLTNKQRHLFHDFFLVMSRSYIPVYASTLETTKDDIPKFQRYQAAKSNIVKIERQFISNFLSNQEENEYVIIDNTIDEKKPENSTYGRKRLVALPPKLPLIDLSTDEIDNMRISTIKKNYKAHFDFYKLIGIEFSDFFLLPNNRELIKILNNALVIHDNLAQRLAKKQKLFNPIKDIQEPLKYLDENLKLCFSNENIF